MNLITILGPTATGKTHIAAILAARIGGEIISADSRQVYKNMNLGTGKDYDDYFVNGVLIPFHLVDIVEAGSEYNVFQYQKDFTIAFLDIQSRKKIPILCGGSGLYLEAVLKGYKLIQVPVNHQLRAELADKTLAELSEMLEKMKTLHNVTDIVNKKRAVRAIEIEKYYAENNVLASEYPIVVPVIFGISCERETTKKRITERLKKRIEQGLVDEVSDLLKHGLKPEQLIYYGLEYKFITLYLKGELSAEKMFIKLNIAIHQFSKRQMTWFRRMEKNGMKIHWIDCEYPDEIKLEKMIEICGIHS